MNPANYLWLTAGIAGITAAWSQVRSFFSRFTSLFFVTASLDADASGPIFAWLSDRSKLSPFGSNTYVGMNTFIRPKDRYGLVAFRVVGKNMTFFIGWTPIFVSVSANAGEQRLVTISYFRGTFDVEETLVKAMDAWNGSTKIGTERPRGRYRVRRVMGKQYAKHRDEQYAKSGESPSVSGGHPTNDTRSMVPLGYSREDLVAPTVESPFSNLFYTPEVNDFVRQVRNWHRSEQWYIERGINWRFGGALYGPPGTGKTSLARALAQELDMPVNIMDLTTMDNNDLVDCWSAVVSDAPCVVLLEDLDRVFDVNAKRDNSKDVGPTLDCLLNCISGIEPANGILVIATANDITKLDPALGVPDATGKSTRPGRLDVGVYLGPLTEAGRQSIANRIIPAYNHDHTLSYTPRVHVDKLVVDGDGDTGAQFTKRCADKALELYWRKDA